MRMFGWDVVLFVFGLEADPPGNRDGLGKRVAPEWGRTVDARWERGGIVSHSVVCF